MLNIGGPEFLIILLVALVVLGPTRLPDALRQVGKFIGEAKKLSSSFQNEVQEAMKDPVKAATGVELPKTTKEAVNKFGVGAPFSAQEKVEPKSQDAPPQTAPDGEGDGLGGEAAPNVEASIETAKPAQSVQPRPEPFTNESSANPKAATPTPSDTAQGAAPYGTESTIEPAALPPNVSGYDPVGEVGAKVNGDGRDDLSGAKPLPDADDDVPMFGDR